MKLGHFLRKLDVGWAAYCPGCHEMHIFDRDRWEFNEDLEKPSFSPSLVVDPNGDKRCHSFVIEGKWVFLEDCWHELKSTEVPMVKLD